MGDGAWGMGRQLSFSARYVGWYNTKPHRAIGILRSNEICTVRLHPTIMSKVPRHQLVVLPY